MIRGNYLRLGSVGELRQYLADKGVRTKVRKGSDGRVFGGRIYSRGALYQLLKNRLYLGQIAHQGGVYAGQHDAIIDQQVWDRVERQLAKNNQAHRTRRATSPSSPLTGLLRDTSGIRFTPTHAMKDGKRYRYYSSQAAIQNREDRPQVARYPATELENLVSGQIHGLLGSLEKYLGSQRRTPEADLAINRGRHMATQWPKLDSSKRLEFVRSVLKAVTIGAGNVWIEVGRSQLVAMLIGAIPPPVAATGEGKVKTIKLAISFRPVRRRGEVQIQLPRSAPGSTRPVLSLVKIVARAHDWYEQLVSGRVISVEQLAQQSGFKSRSVRKILQAAVLSPEIVEAILEGKLGKSTVAEDLHSGLPLDWNLQMSTLLST